MRMMGVLYFSLLALCVLVTGFRMPSTDDIGADSDNATSCMKMTGDYDDLATRFDSLLGNAESRLRGEQAFALSNLHAIFKDLKSDIMDLKSDIKDLGTKMETADKELKSDIKDLGTKMETADKELKLDIKDLGTKIEMTDKDLKADIKDLSIKLESENKGVRSEIKTLQARVVALIQVVTLIFFAFSTQSPALQAFVPKILEFFHAK